MIDVVVRTPITVGGTPLRHLGSSMKTYSHSISSIGGFTTAQITLVTDMAEAASWHDNGVGRHIETTLGGMIAWEGIVDRVDITVGTATTSRGNLMDTANKVRATYQLYTFGGIVPGGQFITSFASNPAAQAGFYILEADLAAGTLISAGEATEIRDLYLTEHAFPPSNSNLSTSAGGVSVSLSCVGYHRLLEKYYYLLAVDALVEATEKIKDVLDADPNSLINWERGIYETISFQVNSYEDWSRTAWDIIFELISIGSSNDTRMLFGIYEHRTPVLLSIPESIFYEAQMGGRDRIEVVGGGDIHPALVRPGNIMRIKDMSLTAAVPSIKGLKSSQRDVFVEDLTYTAPGDLVINGSLLDTFTQRLSRYNFGLV